MMTPPEWHVVDRLLVACRQDQVVDKNKICELRERLGIEAQTFWTPNRIIFTQLVIEDVRKQKRAESQLLVNLWLKPFYDRLVTNGPRHPGVKRASAQNKLIRFVKKYKLRV